MKRLLPLFLCVLPSLAQASADAYRLSWRSDPATSMVIGWNQTSGSDPVLCYDTVDHDRKAVDYRFSQAPDRIVSYRGMSNHFVRLEQLTPDTAYYFVLRDTDGVGRRLWFKTAPATPQPFTMIAGGDSRNWRQPDARRAGNLLVSKLRPLCVLFGGDYTRSGTPQQWNLWFADWQLTISADGRLYPIIATHGNHENADLTMMDQLFDTPHIDQYYSLGFGGGLLRIWALNTELEYIAPEKLPAQQAWIEQDLAAHPDVTWKIATYHRPMRPHTSHKGEGISRIAAWASLFHTNGVDLIVESDTHMVKRSYPVRPSDGPDSYESFVRDDADGMVFIGEGSWGAPIRPANDDKPWTMASDSFDQFKWIQVHPDELLIRTVRFDEADKVVPLTETNRFDEPAGMRFWEPPTGKILRIPFDTSHPTYQRPPEPRLLLARGATWSWSLDGVEWAEGIAPIGYGDGDMRTRITKKSDSPNPVIFKRNFTITDPSVVSRLFFDLQVDGGCDILLNGQPARRHNMRGGKLTRESTALKQTIGWAKNRVTPLPVDTSLLVAGNNTITATVYQFGPDSSDLIFDLAVRAIETPKSPRRPTINK